MIKNNMNTDRYDVPLNEEYENNTDPNDNIHLFDDLYGDEEEDEEGVDEEDFFDIPGLVIFQK